MRTVKPLPIVFILILICSTFGAAQQQQLAKRYSFEDMVREANSFELSPSAELSAAQPKPLLPESTTDCGPGRTWGSSNTGIYYTGICVSEHGNITRFTSPAGYEHIRVGDIVEGYTLSRGSASDYTAYYDAGNVESGWGPATISHISSGALVVTRRTNSPETGYTFELTQIFYMHPDDREGFIYMRVTNLSQVYVYYLYLARYFDGDIDNSGLNDVYNRTADSVEGRQPGLKGHGLMLDVVGSYYWSPGSNTWESSSAPYSLAVLKKPFDPSKTTRTSVTTPTPSGDYLGFISVFLDQLAGTLATSSGNRKAVMFRYRRF